MGISPLASYTMLGLNKIIIIIIIIIIMKLIFMLFLSQVVQECKEIYENSLVDGNPAKAGFLFPKLKCFAASKGSLWRKLT
jgi:hypothetical protein